MSRPTRSARCSGRSSSAWSAPGSGGVSATYRQDKDHRKQQDHRRDEEAREGAEPGDVRVDARDVILQGVDLLLDAAALDVESLDLVARRLHLLLERAVLVLAGGELPVQRVDAVLELLDLLAQAALRVGELREQGTLLLTLRVGRGGPRRGGGAPTPATGPGVLVFRLCRTGQEDDPEQNCTRPARHGGRSIAVAPRRIKLTAAAARACARRGRSRARDAGRTARRRSARCPCRSRRAGRSRSGGDRDTSRRRRARARGSGS